MTEKYILTGNVQNGRQYQITDIEEDYAYRNNKKDKQKLCNLLNKLVEEKEILEVQLKSATNEIDKLNTEINMLTDTCHDCCKEIREENKQLRKLLEYGLEVSQVEIDEELWRLRK